MLEKHLSFDQQYQKSVQKLDILHAEEGERLFKTPIWNLFSSSCVFTVRNEHYSAVSLM
jgi:hypothetical protein